MLCCLSQLAGAMAADWMDGSCCGGLAVGHSQVRTHAHAAATLSSAAQVLYRPAIASVPARFLHDGDIGFALPAVRWPHKARSGLDWIGL